MKIKLAAFALLISGALCCSDSNAQDMLGRMLGRGNCGCDAAPTCCDTPAACCGGQTFSSNVRSRHCGFLSGLCGRGVGCGSYADAGCGCDSSIANDGGCCGMGGKRRGLLSGCFGKAGRGSGNDCCVADTGCDNGCSGAPVAAGCGTDAAPVSCCNADPCGDSSGGLLAGMMARHRAKKASRGAGCGCGSMGDDCGCAAAPVAAGCGCNDAAAADCCGDPCADGCGCGFLSGLRARHQAKKARRGAMNGGCCATTTDCGCGSAPMQAAGCGCNGGSAAPATAQPMDVQGQPMEVQGQPAEAQPAGEVVTPPANSGANRINAPMVDPNSFIIRNTGYRN